VLGTALRLGLEVGLILVDALKLGLEVGLILGDALKLGLEVGPVLGDALKLGLKVGPVLGTALRLGLALKLGLEVGLVLGDALKLGLEVGPMERKLRGFHVYLLQYTDFAYDRVQVSMEKATFITSDYSIELPAPDYLLELPDPNVKSTLNTNTAAAVPYPDVRIRLNTNTTAEETKEECDDPFGLDNVAPPLEYKQYEQSKRKRISCMDVAYI
jgi:hypothetical protein